jgi:RNA polymerase sigma-70 factor (ECF subfamily)
MASAAYTPSSIGTEEVSLIREILGGRRDLFGDLITPHLRPLIQIVRATMGGHPDVDDIVQQTALKALTRLEQFRCEASFRTWLIKIGLNEVRDWRRKCVSSRLLALDVPTLAQFPDAEERHSPLVECQRNEAVVRLRAALPRLPKKYRLVIILRDFEDLNFSEIAQRLGLTIPTVKTRHLRARRKLATVLAWKSHSQPAHQARK